MNRLDIVLLLILAITSGADARAAGFMDYVQEYQLGIDYTTSYDRVQASYEIESAERTVNDCGPVEEDPNKQRCHVNMLAGQSSGWGLFIQQAFKRQGPFYFSADVGFGLRYLRGELEDDSQKKSLAQGLPLKSIEFSLYALVIKPYVQLGLTPREFWPDILVSLGPSLQVAAGTVAINDEEAYVLMGTSSGADRQGLLGGFFEVEVVFLRFGDGALSLFNSRDYTRSELGTSFYPHGVDGMEDFRANFSRQVGGDIYAGFGAKLVLDWP